MMMKFKDGKTLEQAADAVLRDYLIRCYATVSKQYQPIAAMSPEDGVAYLFELKSEGKIIISLDAVGDLIECKIASVN